MEINPVSINPNIKFGQPCLTGTRVPAYIVLQYLYQNKGNVREASRRFALDYTDISVMQAEEAMLWLIQAMSWWILAGEKRLEWAVKNFRKPEPGSK